MPVDPNILKGTVHGKTIELEREPGLPEGQSVTVTVTPMLPTGDGLRRSFGAWSTDSDDLDEFLERIRRDRRQARFGNGQ